MHPPPTPANPVEGAVGIVDGSGTAATLSTLKGAFEFAIGLGRSAFFLSRRSLRRKAYDKEMSSSLKALGDSLHDA